MSDFSMKILSRLFAILLVFPSASYAQTYPAPTFSSLTLQTPLSVANGGTGATSSTGTGSLVLGTSPTLASPTITGSLTATGLVSNADLATQSANTLLGNGTSSTASPSALAVPSCSATGSALGWTSGTGFTCFTGYAPLASPTFTGTVTLKALTQASTGNVFQNLGATIDRQNDRLFVGTATDNDANSTQSVGDWTFNQYSVGGVGAFAYLEHNGTMNVGSPNGQPALVAATRSSDSGAAGNAAIGLSSVAVNDNAIGAGADTWNYYGTTVRAAGATGESTIGFESDVTNLGSLVPIYPSSMFPNGLTANLWLAAGGELPNQSGNSYTFHNVSAAIGIFANAPGSPTPATQYDKGIVFGAGSIAGALAIALPTNYSMTWFNSNNQTTNAIFSSATTATGGTPASIQKLQFSDYGTLFVDGSGNTQFQIQNGVASAVNHVASIAGATTVSPIIEAAGSDTNVSLTLQGQGTGTVNLPQDDVLTYSNTSGQSISNATTTIVTGWTKTFDRLGTNFNASTGVFTAPISGYYHISAQLVYASHTGVVNADYAAVIVANGVSVAAGSAYQESTSSDEVSVTVTADVYLSTGQTADLQAYQNSGAAVTLDTNAAHNYLSIHRIP